VAEVDVEGYPLPAKTGLLTLKTTVTIELKGPDGEGVADEPYIVTFSNGEVRKGTLDGSGKAELREVPPCTHQVEWPRRGGVQRLESEG
jgi:hypothetical protein